jgi:hypothetical protein
MGTDERNAGAIEANRGSRSRAGFDAVVVNDWSSMDAVYKAIKELTSVESLRMYLHG